MIETILKKLLDRDYPDHFMSGLIGDTLRFEFNNICINVEYNAKLKEFDVMFFINDENNQSSKNYCRHRVKFEDEVEQLRAELNFKSLVQKGIDRLDSEVYAKVMGIEIEPEHPTTFDDAQTQIVNNNVEE